MKKVEPKKTGRPSSNEDRPRLKLVAFKLDDETKAALDRLVARATNESTVKLIRGGLRSAVLRQLIIDADKARSESDAG